MHPDSLGVRKASRLITVPNKDELMTTRARRRQAPHRPIGAQRVDILAALASARPQSEQALHHQSNIVLYLFFLIGATYGNDPPPSRHSSEGWSPCLSSRETAPEKATDMDASLRWHDENDDRMRSRMKNIPAMLDACFAFKGPAYPTPLSIPAHNPIHPEHVTQMSSVRAMPHHAPFRRSPEGPPRKNTKSGVQSRATGKISLKCPQWPFA